VDIAVPAGTEVRAAAGGTVTASTYGSVGGNYVIITHENGTQSYYGHLQTRTVSKGDSVERGQIIGLSGATGKVTGAHLHFQLTYNDRTVDPQKYVDLTP
jgi:murein DD-endopeptidase MepM/ murein hydrolase activator NlpD